MKSLRTNLGTFVAGIATFAILFGVLWLIVAAELYINRTLGLAALTLVAASLPPLWIYDRKPRFEITNDLQIKQTIGRRANALFLGAAWADLIVTVVIGSIVMALLQDRIH